MWTTPSATDMRFGFEVTMYVMNRQYQFKIDKNKCRFLRHFHIGLDTTTK